MDRRARARRALIPSLVLGGVGTSTLVSVTAGGWPASDGVLWPNLDGAGNSVAFQSTP